MIKDDPHVIADITVGELDILQDELNNLRGRLTAIVQTAGGIVEGHPTGSHNILQRIRELREIEAGR
jgi:hypothetical protein